MNQAPVLFSRASPNGLVGHGRLTRISKHNVVFIVAADEPSSPSRPRPLQFSLRAMLVLMVVAAWFSLCAAQVLNGNSLLAGLNAFVISPIAGAAAGWYLFGKRAWPTVAGGGIVSALRSGLFGALDAMGIGFRPHRQDARSLGDLLSSAATGATMGVVIGGIFGIVIGATFAAFASDEALRRRRDPERRSDARRIGLILSFTSLFGGLALLVFASVGWQLDSVLVGFVFVIAGLVGSRLVRKL